MPIIIIMDTVDDKLIKETTMKTAYCRTDNPHYHIQESKVEHKDLDTFLDELDSETKANFIAEMNDELLADVFDAIYYSNVNYVDSVSNILTNKINEYYNDKLQSGDLEVIDG